MKPKAGIWGLILALWMLAGCQTVFASGKIFTKSDPALLNIAAVKAERVIPAVSCRSLPREDFSKLVDNDQYTYFRVKKAVTLDFKNPVPVSHIYLMFENPCEWTLTLPDGKVKKNGEYGFLHELVVLDKPVRSFSLSVPSETKLTEVHTFTEGELPDWVQIWQPPCEKADLLILPTHPDDEHLWFGGAMPYYAGELGYDVQVAYLTYQRRDTYRGHELLNGLWTVGVRHYPIITERFADTIETKGSIEKAAYVYGRNKVLEYQVELLRRFSPKVVLGHAVNGEYGHGAHQLNAATLLDALKIYDDPEQFPKSAEKYGTGRVGKCYLHLWKKNPVTVGWSDKILTRFGGKTAFEMACEGYNCHKSQLRWNNHVEESGRFDCRQFGLAYTTVGYDTPGLNDLFEHVDVSDMKKPEEDKHAHAEKTSPSDIDESDVTADETISVGGIKMLKNDAKTWSMLLLTILFTTFFVICLIKRGLFHNFMVLLNKLHNFASLKK